MRRFAVLLALLAVACQSGAPPTGPGRASDEDGAFRLTFVVGSTTVGADEPIVGQAQLELLVGNEARLSGPAGGVLSFEFVEVGGDRRMTPIWDSACARHLVRADRPITSAIEKSGSWSEDAPHGAFYRDFFLRPDVRLPAGEWDVTAIASFVDGDGCAGARRELRATIRIHVVA